MLGKQDAVREFVERVHPWGWVASLQLVRRAHATASQSPRREARKRLRRRGQAAAEWAVSAAIGLLSWEWCRLRSGDPHTRTMKRTARTSTSSEQAGELMRWVMGEANEAKTVNPHPEAP
jgi:hypothetical protein